MKKILTFMILLVGMSSCLTREVSGCQTEEIYVNPNDGSKGKVVYLHCKDSVYVFDPEGKLLRKVSTGKK